MRRCGKVTFPDEHTARVELVGAIVAHNRGRTKRRERRIYYCRDCAGWHLTSRPFRPRRMEDHR